MTTLEPTSEPLPDYSTNLVTGEAGPPLPPRVLPVDLTHLVDQPRTLREILFMHRATAAATALEITELMAEVQRWRTGVSLDWAERLLADARQQRDNARGQDTLFSQGAGTYEAQWERQNPGMAAALRASES